MKDISVDFADTDNTWQSVIAARYHNIQYIKTPYAKTVYDAKQLVTSNAAYLNFTSNDYLNLSNHSALIATTKEAIYRYGVGSTGAPTLSGYNHAHEQLATHLAQWLNYEKCLLLSTGYQVGVGLFKQLADQDTTIWFDKRCHASHIDGILLSKGKFVTFTPDTIGTTVAQIKQQSHRRHIILTEGVFSMDGTCDYLHELVLLKQTMRDQILLIVDDAHGIGVLGHNGLGTFEYLQLDLSAVDLLIGTLSKTFAVQGGFICGNQLLIDYLQQTMRSYLFSTCLPPALSAATLASLDVIQSDMGINLREQLHSNIAYFKKQCVYYRLPLYNQAKNNSPVQLLVFTAHELVADVASKLLNRNILVGKIFYPTVPISMPRIRISLSANLQLCDIDYLCSSIRDVLGDI